MDDFRVGSVPSSDPYGNRQPSGSIQRKREKHHNGEGDPEQQDEPDTLELTAPAEDSSGEGESIEDYYLPSEPGDAD